MCELYSERKRRELGEAEVYLYNIFSAKFRNQCLHIISNLVQKMDKGNYARSSIWVYICENYAMEKGLKYLLDGHGYNKNGSVAYEFYFDNCSDSDFLDILEFTFRYYIANKELYDDLNVLDSRMLIENAINNLNKRLKENSLGYEYVNNEIIIKTNTFTHEAIIKPALKLLLDEKFRGAEEEYLKAFEHFKVGNNADAIINGAKAFESTMKIICEELNYPYDKQKDTSKKLIDILKSQLFFPTYLNAHMSGICTTLETGAPVIRNKLAGHGQGQEIQTITDEYVEYILNLVATNIILLYKRFKNKSL